VSPAPRLHEDDGDPEAGPPAEERGETARRRAGCIWQFIAEQWLILGLTLAAALFGRAYLVGRARKLRSRKAEEDARNG
jgi:hypothetical protein